ncbi:MAG: alkaline phosphatase family protein, partial [Myxococcota bacterium]
MVVPFLSWLVACPKGPAGVPTPGPTADSAPPRLVVLVVVDQLPIRLLDATKEWFTGGFSRLTGPTAWTGVGHYAHATTFTCPGHATLSTGAAPSVSGIVSNDWVADGKPQYCGDAALLRVPTLADQVAAAGGSVGSISLKDRGAIMLGGSHANLVAWWDKKALRFTPPLDDLDPAPYLASPWTASHPEAYAARMPDAGPTEADPGIGTTFPHPAVADQPGAFLFTPFAGSALTDAAIATVDRLDLGADDTADLLTVSYSQIDYIGHAFTSESWEALDGMVRLDADLARLFAHLDQKVGADRYTVFLSADHGSTPTGGARVPYPQVEEAAKAVLAARGVAGEVAWDSPSLWLPPEVRTDPAVRGPLAIAVAEAIRAIPGIGGAWAWKDQPVDGPYADAVNLSLDPDRSGDVYVLLAPGALYDDPGDPGKGTSHGTPYDDDTRVP